mgnify:CR=1 FL=1
MYKRYQTALFFLGYLLSALALLACIGLDQRITDNPTEYSEWVGSMIALYILTVGTAIHGRWKNNKTKILTGNLRKYDLFYHYFMSYFLFMGFTGRAIFLVYNYA